MNQIQLNKSWPEFKEELNVFINEGTAMLDRPAGSAETVTELENTADTWADHVKRWLQNSFNVPANRYVILFHNAGANHFSIPNQKMNTGQQLARLKGQVQNRTDTLFLLGRILSISDAVVRPDTVDFEKRANLTIRQKREFILDKLYELYDDLYYSLDEILEGNAIVMKRSSEAGEMAAMLEDQGYVHQIARIGSSVSIRLTTEGARMIEDALEKTTENYDDIQYSYAEMSAKIDEINNKLKRTNMGHEVLYDELQELKELYVTLNKKSWGQLLKGKLFDVALGKLVDNATIAFVFEAITDHKLKLLS